MVRCLSIHASYACERSGACCTSAWPIPIEPDRLTRLGAALAAGTVRRADDRADDPTQVDETAGVVLATSGGRCVFFEPAGDRQPSRPACAIHRAIGHDALPLACRQFPRISVRDPRGVSLTLSHYCPTAARLLDAGSTLSITTNPSAFPSQAEYIGLEATTSLPPRLRPDMLMDWEAWWEWEELAVSVLADPSSPVEVQVARLSLAVEDLRRWRPGPTALTTTLREAITHARQRHIDPFALDGRDRSARQQEIVSAMDRPLGRTATAVVGGRALPSAARGLVTAHAFGNWTAHLGQGLRAWLRSVEAPLVLLRSGLTIRETDLWLRHLADPARLADIWSQAEAPTSRP